MLCLYCSSECSDGEWSASGPFCFAAAAKSVSDESWGTLPGREEREPEEVEVYIGSGLGGRYVFISLSNLFLSALTSSVTQ